jgi:hypothetical protein
MKHRTPVRPTVARALYAPSPATTPAVGLAPSQIAPDVDLSAPLVPGMPAPVGTSLAKLRARVAAAPPPAPVAAPVPPPTVAPTRYLVAVVRDFYADPVAWLGLVICTLILTYVGGASMFWFHALYLGEGGPAISPWLHWGLDSSAGFLGLTPFIAIIIPIAAWTAMLPGPGEVTIGAVRAGRFALVGGVLLALVTAPAPLFHDTFLARGTWLADHLTDMWGGPEYLTGHVHHRDEGNALIAMVQQVGWGIITYIPLMFVALLAVRLLTRPFRRSLATEPAQP